MSLNISSDAKKPFLVEARRYPQSLRILALYLAHRLNRGLSNGFVNRVESDHLSCTQ